MLIMPGSGLGAGEAKGKTCLSSLAWSQDLACDLKAETSQPSSQCGQTLSIGLCVCLCRLPGDKLTCSDNASLDLESHLEQ